MNNRLLDIVIPIIKVDAEIFLSNLTYIKNNLPVKNIILIGPTDVYPIFKSIDDVIFIDEDSVVPGMTLSRIKEIKKLKCGSERRAGWYFQQFLKMGYSLVSKDQYYLIWDSDTIPITKIDFFTKSGSPYLSYRDYVKFDECFFRTQNKLLPNEVLKKHCKESFITEHLLVNVDIMKNLIFDLQKNKEYSQETFYGNILSAVEMRDINLSGFSEFETYSAYVLKYYPDFYVLRYWNNLRNAKIFIGDHPTVKDINWIGNHFNVISIEDFDRQWLICKLFVFLNRNLPFKFSYIYRFMKPLIFHMEEVRQFIRNNFKK